MHIYEKNCVIWERIRRHSLFNGVEEIERNFKFVGNGINQHFSSQKVRYLCPKHEVIDQFENMFVFDLKTCNVEKIAEAHEAGLFDVNRLEDRWYTDLTPEQKEIERDFVIVFDG